MGEGYQPSKEKENLKKTYRNNVMGLFYGEILYHRFFRVFTLEDRTLLRERGVFVKHTERLHHM
jgi:hypothetical protein